MLHHIYIVFYCHLPLVLNVCYVTSGKLCWNASYIHLFQLNRINDYIDKNFFDYFAKNKRLHPKFNWMTTNNAKK